MRAQAAPYVSTGRTIGSIRKIDLTVSRRKVGQAAMAREKMKDARRGDAAATDASSWARLIRRLPSSSSHCRLQERTDSLALSIYRQIYGPKLGHQLCPPTSAFGELIVGGRKEARVAAWVSGLAAGDGLVNGCVSHLRLSSLPV